MSRFRVLLSSVTPRYNNAYIVLEPDRTPVVELRSTQHEQDVSKAIPERYVCVCRVPTEVGACRACAASHLYRPVMFLERLRTKMQLPQQDFAFRHCPSSDLLLARVTTIIVSVAVLPPCLRHVRCSVYTGNDVLALA